MHDSAMLHKTLMEETIMIDARLEPDVVSQEAHTLPERKQSLGADPDVLSGPTAPEVVQVTDDERDHIARAAGLLSQRYGSIDSPEFRRMLPALAGQHLPQRLYMLLADFRDAFQRTDYGALILKKMLNVDQDSLGPTPARWQEAELEKIKPYEFITALIHGALGGTLAQFYYQRKGGGFSHCVIQDPAMKETETGAGEVELRPHTESANLHHSPDFITFLWLRNIERVPCYLFSIRSLDLAEKRYEKILREPIFKKPLVADNLASEAQQWADQAVPVLYGNPLHPWLRVDFIEQLSSGADQSQRAQQALEAFEQDARAATYTALVPGGGDLCVLNNKMCAHGRGPVQAGVDSNANAVEKRWMLRMMSVVDRFAFYETAHSRHPYFSKEMHTGKTVELQEITLP